MRKIARILSICFAFICIVILASCGKKSNVNVAVEQTVGATSAIFEFTFSENEHLASGDAIPHVKKYAYSDTDENHVGDYLSENQVVSFDGGTFTHAKLEFKDLLLGTKYTFCMYITFNAEEELIKTWTIETLSNSNGAFEISTVADLDKMATNPEGNYVLVKDIDCGGNKIKSVFTSSKPYKGVFDGNGHTISNFVLDTSTNGIFAYTRNATIKNLKLSLNESAITYDATSGKSSADIGILAGKAEETTFENITITNASFSLASYSTSTTKINVGTLVGYADKCSFKNCDVANTNMFFKRIRRQLKAGLFAGVVVGNSTTKEDDVVYAVSDCSASGKIEGTLYYTENSDPGTAIPQVCIGGFIGSTGTKSLIKNSYSKTNILMYRDEGVSNGNYYNLSIGGFIGGNYDGSIKLLGCAEVGDITVIAGVENSTYIPEEMVLSKYCVNIGGLIGSLSTTHDTIENCVYVKNDTGVVVKAKALNDEDEELVRKNNTIAYILNNSGITNVGSLVEETDVYDTSVLADNVKSIVEGK